MSGAVLIIQSMSDGSPSPYDGQYLVEYDPERDGVAPSGAKMICHVEATPDRAKARVFPTKFDAMQCWETVSKRQPTRPWDGKPNRPLTAFTVTIEDA